MSIEGRGAWKGWEYVSANGLHMVVSKSHFFKNGDRTRPAVCGARMPELLDSAPGNDDCKRCKKALSVLERKHEATPFHLRY